MLHAIGSFISSNQLFSGLGGLVVIALATALVRSVGRRRANRLALRQPRDVEVIPLWFEVSLVQQIPEVCIWVQIVNYLRKELRLTQISAPYFHIDTGGPPMENIPAVDYRIPPRQSSQVMCRRHLLDAEAKVLSAVPWADRFAGQLHIRVRGVAGRKGIELDLTGFRIHGWVTGLPSHPGRKPAPTGSQ